MFQISSSFKTKVNSLPEPQEWICLKFEYLGKYCEEAGLGKELGDWICYLGLEKSGDTVPWSEVYVLLFPKNFYEAKQVER